MNKNIYRQGFTLVELIVVIMVLGIIAAIAIPSFLAQLRNAEAKQIENELRTFLINSKQYALIYHSTVISCVANNNKQCLIQDGQFLLSFIDKNNNQILDNTDYVLENDKVTLRYGKLMTHLPLNKNYITMNPSTGNPIGYMGHIKYCPNNGDTTNMYKVTFNITGIIKTKKNSEEATGCA